MKIHILFTITDEPWGGGNQFIKLLKKYFIKKNIYSDNPEQSDIILFNSHQMIDKVAALKKQFPFKKFAHRIDGPIRLYNNISDPRDAQIYFANEIFADGTIFQSEWSKRKNEQLGLENTKPYAIIPNCSDFEIFSPSLEPENKKMRLISTSFSPNPKKGLDTYEYLDKNLDFQKFSYVFLGRLLSDTEAKFNNIKNLGLKNSHQVADELRKSDIFITASQSDPCSNSLIEGLSCGLPALALNDGGHPEIIKKGGLLFEKRENIPNLLNQICQDISSFKSQIKVRRISETGGAYISFFEALLNS